MNPKITLKERFFVAGANGMVGSAVCNSLKLKGYGKKHLGGSILDPNRKELDLLNENEVNDWFNLNKPSITILAAAKVGGIYANSKYPYDFLIENLKIQNNVIENSYKHGVKRLIFLGSSCIYPKYSKQPIQEESLLSGELESTNEAYALAKISGIKLCESLKKQHGFDAISLMPTNLYGPGDNYHPLNSHVMPSLIRKFSEAKRNNQNSVTCWGSGKPLREFMHVQDLAEAIIYCLEKWDPFDDDSPKQNNGECLHFLNVGTGKDISIKELVEKIAKIINYKGEIQWDKNKPDGTPQKKLDVSRINSLGWYSKINLDEGIINTINDFENQFN